MMGALSGVKVKDVDVGHVCVGRWVSKACVVLGGQASGSVSVPHKSPCWVINVNVCYVSWVW